MPEEIFYTPQEVADRWKVHPQTIRRVFRDREDVLRTASTAYSGAKRTTFRIPSTVLAAVEKDRSRNWLSVAREGRGSSVQE